MKNNKGITLIALVVTIIILLILAGVSITTLSGNGLFGRAESSAAKYQQASENENSTLSSLMDKYDHYESQTTEMVTLKWTSPIATNGTFMNDTTPEDYVKTGYYDKEIIAIEPDGTKIVINPYLTLNRQFPLGTKLRFYYYEDESENATHGTYIGVGNYWTSSAVLVSNKLYYLEVALDKKGTCEMELTQDETSDYMDGTYSYGWFIFSEYLGGPYK